MGTQENIDTVKEIFDSSKKIKIAKINTVLLEQLIIANVELEHRQDILQDLKEVTIKIAKELEGENG